MIGGFKWIFFQISAEVNCYYCYYSIKMSNTILFRFIPILKKNFVILDLPLLFLIIIIIIVL